MAPRREPPEEAHRPAERDLFNQDVPEPRGGGLQWGFGGGGSRPSQEEVRQDDALRRGGRDAPHEDRGNRSRG